MEKKRLKELQRHFYDEIQDIEQNILQASINKLKKEAAERSMDASEISDGLQSPLAEDTESICSDVFGPPDVLPADRTRKRSQLMSLDENSELGAPPMRPTTKARPVTRRSISRELLEEQSKPPPMARPNARRSISRELYDVNFTPNQGNANNRLRRERPDIEELRNQIRDRESSMSREMADFVPDHFRHPSLSPAAKMFAERNNNNNSRGNRGFGRQLSNGFPENGNDLFMGMPTRPKLASHGRSVTQNDMFPRNNFMSSPVDNLMFKRSFESDNLSPPVSNNNPNPMFVRGLDERDRGDWRRVSVPERGKDFKSLPRKYNR